MADSTTERVTRLLHVDWTDPTNILIPLSKALPVRAPTGESSKSQQHTHTGFSFVLLQIIEHASVDLIKATNVSPAVKTMRLVCDRSSTCWREKRRK